jgi:hypothetical protein
LDLSAKKAKLLPDWQAYSQLYYETKLKDIVDARWPAERERRLKRKENGENIKEPPEFPPLSFRNEVARTMLEDETDEVKEEVKKHRRAGSADEKLDEDVDAEEAKRVAKAIAMNQ